MVQMALSHLADFEQPHLHVLDRLGGETGGGLTRRRDV
jgi:hypothetical protein